ncbi:hypothetical protein [Ramlibacter alkalitolerans]|uniref:Uncharacterized protein n=1 Tax=Ramlibacter alkalitolerans TaxID=2039631 RepID=A0ABS1JU33_9BURK|nr:hypothetical protein [Ramlibacter alkalitolerans]MBL0427712.1 hypothetical protein [Ramlibacter alkalitolerans]
MPAGQPVLQARLLNDIGSNALTGLNNAHVTRIERGGLMISGFEDTPKAGAPVRQAWWCVPLANQPRPPEAAREQPKDGRRGWGR